MPAGKFDVLSDALRSARHAHALVGIAGRFLPQGEFAFSASPNGLAQFHLVWRQHDDPLSPLEIPTYQWRAFAEVLPASATITVSTVLPCEAYEVTA